jgi:bifunctional non-homologous end joining protein LigD
MSLKANKIIKKLNKPNEPLAELNNQKTKLSFVVQLHKATNLHYDFRLEMNGVLKSWVIPKGPIMKPGEKRLALMVDDHPYEYKDFEGVIPEGNYGAGIVKIWDKGYYSDDKNSSKKISEKKLLDELKAGNLNFTLFGKKLKGKFALVLMKTKQKNNWLLIKQNDELKVKDLIKSEKKKN